jgi:hypothetical protein
MLGEAPLNSHSTGNACLLEDYHNACHLEAKAFTLGKLRSVTNISFVLIRDSEKKDVWRKARMRKWDPASKDRFVILIPDSAVEIEADVRARRKPGAAKTPAISNCGIRVNL